MESISLARVVTVLIYVTAGGGMSLLLLNRRLLVLPDHRWKMPGIFLALSLIMVLAAVAGWFLPVMPWVLLPAAFIVLLLIGEVRLFLIRRRSAGSPPVASTPYRLDLLDPITTTDLVRYQFQLRLPAWQGGPLRIVHFSDLHVNHNVPMEYFHAVFRLAEETRADLAVLTGDFVSKARFIPELRKILRPVARHGTFAVLGNHDVWAGAPEVRAAVHAAGITLLTGNAVDLEVHGGRLRISGYDHPWGRRHEPLPTPPPTGLHLVLSHTPDNIYRLNHAGAHAVFSGHNHAGQVRLPLIGSIVVPSKYGRRFDFGHYVVRGTHLFVSAGIGASNPSFRIYCPPDIFIVDIVSS